MMSRSRRNFLVSVSAGLGLIGAGLFGWRALRSREGVSLTTLMQIERHQKELGLAAELHFSGRASPLAAYQSAHGEVDPRSFFPNSNDPFAIDDDLTLGDGGYSLQVRDRGMQGIFPAGNDAPYALNMIPFGVAMDGVILDPSGPWYDGGSADPTNAFDRECSGWEYEVMHPTVADLVGVAKDLVGHVQPSGMFHYHGYPELLALLLGSVSPAGTKLMGFSADGFPVTDYRAREPETGVDRFFFSGYVQREGVRQALEGTNPILNPGGHYDGLFVQDYVHDVARKDALIRSHLERGQSYHGLTADHLDRGLATYTILDVRNGTKADGRYGVEHYPDSVWHYVLTPDWPYIPRCFAFQPSESFADVIPLRRRMQLYENCEGKSVAVHQSEGRQPY